jgi:glycerol kinase
VVALDWKRPHPVIVAAPSGLGTPWWHSSDRITMLGAGGSSGAEGIAAAALAGIAHQIADALEAQDAARTMDTVRVGGGLAADGTLLQAVADLSGLELELSSEPEATARGIAAMVGEAVGLREPGETAPDIARRVVPALDAVSRDRERLRWREAVEVHMAERAGE